MLYKKESESSASILDRMIRAREVAETLFLCT
jgi:hypothetical protein